jgi:hypothetical protein
MRKLWSLSVFIIAALSLVFGSSALAGTAATIGTLDTGDPIMDRPDDTGTALSGIASYYEYRYFNVSVSGNYTIALTAAAFTPPPADEGFLALYTDAFAPSNPLANLLEVDNDGGPGLLPTISTYLDAGDTYTIVILTGDPLQTGGYTLQISGPGNITYDVAAGSGRFIDGRVNNSVIRDAIPPVAVYCQPDGAIHVYFIVREVDGAYGVFLFRITAQRIATVGMPTENTVLGFLGNVRVYRLTTGEFQLNAVDFDGTPYIIVWDACPATSYYHLDE